MNGFSDYFIFFINYMFFYNLFFVADHGVKLIEEAILGRSHYYSAYLKLNLRELSNRESGNFTSNSSTIPYFIDDISHKLYSLEILLLMKLLNYRFLSTDSSFLTN